MSPVTFQIAGQVPNFGHCLFVPELDYSVCSVSQDAFLGYSTIYTPTEVIVTSNTNGTRIRICTVFLQDNRYWFGVPPRIRIPRSTSPTSITDPPPHPPPPNITSYDPSNPSTLAGATFISPEPSTTTPGGLVFFTSAHHAPNREEFLYRITGHSPRPTLNRMIARPLLYPCLPMAPFSSHIITNCTTFLQGKMRAGTLHRAITRPALPPTPPSYPTTACFQAIALDITDSGTYTKSFQGHRYSVILSDLYSKDRSIYFMKKKTDFLKFCLTRFESEKVQPRNATVTTYISDGEPLY